MLPKANPLKQKVDYWLPGTGYSGRDGPQMSMRELFGMMEMF